MKKRRPLTWNNFHNWRTQSSSWRYMDAVRDKREWGRYHCIRYTMNVRGEEKEVAMDTPRKNLLWRDIRFEFQALFGDEFEFYKNIVLGDGLDVHIGTTAHSCHDDISIRFTVHGERSTTYTLRPPGNMVYTKDNIERFVMAWVEKNLLFGGGLFRELQLKYGLSKKRVVESYKIMCEAMRDEVRMGSPDVCYLAGFGALRRKYNVTTELDVTLDTAAKWCAKHGRQEKPVKLCKFDMGFLYDIDGDIDEVERAYWEEVSKYPSNVVFV